MKFKILLVSLIVLGFSITGAEAQIVKQTRHQHHRIKQGVKSGELTKAEAANLRKDQKDIRQEVKAAKSDGIVTPAERKDIRKDQKKESRKIFRKKHNKKERN